MSNPIKQIRGQIRQIVKEELPGVLSTETYAELQKEMREAIAKIQDLVKTQLQAIDERTKDVQGVVMRQLAAQMPAVAPETDIAPQTPSIANE